MKTLQLAISPKTRIGVIKVCLICAAGALTASSCSSSSVIGSLKRDRDRLVNVTSASGPAKPFTPPTVEKVGPNWIRDEGNRYGNVVTESTSDQTKLPDHE
ncbi:MAG: hypothetical protein WD824_16390 [Cyclobacteriaceae bacterium]